ncbi:kinase-like domain-containing protein [Cladorrhinum sp. PSN332]|nr:kinase-like domain-containing protein [Cladorrhinum sp. PSN332]
MAVSPLVAPPTDALQQPANTSRSPFKRLSSAVPSSSNGTPMLFGSHLNSQNATITSAPQTAAMTLDPVEQMNETEKRKYIKGKKLGEGTYANVYLGHSRSDPSILVAIKKIKVQQQYKDGLAPDAVRELKVLQELHHPNIISLLSVFSSKDQNLNLVLEYLPLGDLEMLIHDTDGVRYGAADIKAWMGMLTRGVWFCHDNFVLHRDIKPNNLLIAADGEIKLADFGLARGFADPGHKMTSNVITRWYRPPELLFGARAYSGAVDIWSVGMVLAELILRRPYLPGDTEMAQITLICQEVGTPTEDNWPGVTKLRDYAPPGEVTPVKGREHFMRKFGPVGGEGVDLLMKTFALDPKKRITAKEMLEHRWWRTEPRPTRREDLPRKAEGGEMKMGADLKRRNGQVEDEPRGSKVARKLDFGQMK